MCPNASECMEVFIHEKKRKTSRKDRRFISSAWFKSRHVPFDLIFICIPFQLVDAFWLICSRRFGNHCSKIRICSQWAFSSFVKITSTCFNNYIVIYRDLKKKLDGFEVACLRFVNVEKGQEILQLTRGKRATFNKDK